jgi:hypothetical protein
LSLTIQFFSNGAPLALHYNLPSPKKINSDFTPFFCKFVK